MYASSLFLLFNPCMRYLLFFVFCWGLLACQHADMSSSVRPPSTDWEAHRTSRALHALTQGSSYLPVYAQIYEWSEHNTYNLTTTVSIRNTSPKDTLFLLKANYHNTQGKLLRAYIQQPIFIAPLETLEIVLPEQDKEGGTGANFVFDWASPSADLAPLFEAVMISTTGQQGLSFTTSGHRIR